MKRIDVSDADDKKRGRKRFYHPCPKPVEDEWREEGDCWRVMWPLAVDQFFDRVLSGYSTDVARDKNVHAYPAYHSDGLGVEVSFLSARQLGG